MDWIQAVKAGRAFFVDDAATLTDGAARKLTITTPATGICAYMCVNVYATADVTVVLSEGGNRTVGTAVTAYNADRNSAKTAAVTVTHTPTGGTSDGTTIVSHVTPSTGNVEQIIGGGWESGRAIAMKRDRQYILLITDVADGCSVRTQLRWIEEPRFQQHFTTTTTTTTTSSSSSTSCTSSSTSATSSTSSTTSSTSSTSSTTVSSSSTSSTSSTTSSTTSTAP